MSIENNSKKDIILNELSQNGFKLTNQRKIILDVIMSEEYKTCKEIYYLANKKDSSIGIATIYRTLSILEDIGIIDKINHYQVCKKSCCCNNKTCSIVLKNKDIINLSKEKWHDALIEGLKIKGYIKEEEIDEIIYNF